MPATRLSHTTAHSTFLRFVTSMLPGWCVSGASLLVPARIGLTCPMRKASKNTSIGMSAPDTRIIPCSLPTNAFSDALCEVFSYPAETYSTKGFRNLLANKAALHQCKRVCSRWFQWDNFLYTNVV